MSTEYRGEVKPDLWARPTCADDGEPSRLRQMARRDFQEACRCEGDPFDVASADVVGEADELSELNLR